MVRAAGRNTRNRRSGGRNRTVHTAAEQQVSAGSLEQGRTDPVEEEAVPAETVPVQEAARNADSGASPAEEREVVAEETATSGCNDEEEQTTAEGSASAAFPGELDILRGELFSEDLEQNAVEQMFRWVREQGTAESPEESSGISGASLLDAVHHGRHVAFLSLALFEALAPGFELDLRWARLLAQAALWHDLGFAVGGRRRHHKRSMEIIGDNQYLTLSFGLSETERPLVALLARYHRRAWPDRKHRRFAALPEEERRALAGAASLLRVADALDYTHRGAVEELRVEIRRRTLSLVCFGAGSCRKECRRALKKGDLLEKLYGKRLEVVQGKDGERDAC